MSSLLLCTHSKQTHKINNFIKKIINLNYVNSNKLDGNYSNKKYQKSFKK